MQRICGRKQTRREQCCESQSFLEPEGPAGQCYRGTGEVGTDNCLFSLATRTFTNVVSSADMGAEVSLESGKEDWKAVSEDKDRLFPGALR